jgi:FixJ family two-component response regulator
MVDTAPPLVHVVEDNASTRTALARLLRSAGYEVVEYKSATEFQNRPREGRIECAVLDVWMPGLTGMALQQALADAHDPTPVVFLTGQGDISMSVQAMKMGAVDFLTKPVDENALLEAVERALARSCEGFAEQMWLQQLRARYATLTARERQVFAHVVAGQLNKQIASDIGTAERTVKAHRHNVMEKMQAGSVAELVRMAEALEVSLENLKF